MTVEELVETPSFGMTVLGGGSHLGNPVRWVHISTTPDPELWIETGDLVLTSGRNLPADLPAQRELMQGFGRRGAAALAIGSVEGPRDISGLVAGADEFGVPVVAVDRSVPWGQLGRAVADANDTGMRASLRDQIRIFETLQARIDGTIDLPEALRIHSRITHHTLYLVNAAGRPVLSGLKPLPAPLAHALSSERPVIPEGYAVPVWLGTRRVATLVAVQTQPGASGLGAIRHIATLAATELADLERQRETARRVGADAFARIRDGRVSGDAARSLLTELGLNAPRYVFGRVRGGDQVADAVSRLLSDREIPHIIVSDVTGVDVLINEGVDAPWGEISQSAGTIVALSRGFADVRQVGVASRQVEWVLQRAAATDRGAVVFDDAVAAVGWLPPDAASLTSLVQTILGAVIQYDADHDASLLDTLRTYLRRDRSVAAVAAELFVHRQTVNYRLGRISELTGRDLRGVAATAELWLAVNAYDVLSGDLPLAGGAG